MTSEHEASSEEIMNASVPHLEKGEASLPVHTLLWLGQRKLKDIRIQDIKQRGLEHFDLQRQILRDAFVFRRHGIVDYQHHYQHNIRAVKRAEIMQYHIPLQPGEILQNYILHLERCLWYCDYNGAWSIKYSLVSCWISGWTKVQEHVLF